LSPWREINALTDSQTLLSATRKPEFITICTGTSGLYNIKATFFGVPVNQTIVKKGLAGGLMMNVIASGLQAWLLFVAFLAGRSGNDPW
jgi:hypothetical protein